MSIFNKYSDRIVIICRWVGKEITIRVSKQGNPDWALGLPSLKYPEEDI